MKSCSRNAQARTEKVNKLEISGTQLSEVSLLIYFTHVSGKFEPAKHITFSKAHPIISKCWMLLLLIEVYMSTNVWHPTFPLVRDVTQFRGSRNPDEEGCGGER